MYVAKRAPITLNLSCWFGQASPREGKASEINSTVVSAHAAKANETKKPPSPTSSNPRLGQQVPRFEHQRRYAENEEGLTQ
jgi:hypothetical protein